MFASVQQAWELGAVAVGATVYFGSDQGMRQLQEASEAFQMAHEPGHGSPCFGAICGNPPSTPAGRTTTPPPT